MLRIIFILVLPLFLFSKTQVLSYFPLETHLLKKIAQNEIKTREISSRYLENYTELPRSEISRLSNSKIFFHFGLDVEKKYAQVLLEQNPTLIVVDISLNVNRIDANPYIWTDPLNLRVVAKNIYDTFVKYDKKNESYYKENYEKFLDEVDQTFLRIKQKLNTCDTQYIYVFDNYWDYFAKRFGIVTILREKRYLNVSEIPQISAFTKDKNIRKVLFSKNDNHEYTLSLTNNLNIAAIEDDIFNNTWQLNLLNLTQNLAN
ncbi:MAG: zinc ABC transporter substrate-binding protein [Aliarcobacter sp.]|nr:zinc ABC transporter substrate-binding protein [Aliarcobacter sp.]